MASRVIEVLYKLKDLFTPGARKISRGYEEIGSASNDAAKTVERNQSKTRSAIERTGKSFRSLRNIWVSLTAAFSAFEISRTFFQFVDEADRLGKVSAKLGVTVDSLSALSYAAERAGVSTQQFEIAIQRLQRKTGDAVNGLGEAQKAFANFGIDAEKFAELGIEEKIEQLATAFNAVGDEEQALSALQKLVDSEGLGIAVLLQDGPSGIRKLVAEYKKLNPELARASEEAAKYADATTKLAAATEGLFRRGATPVIGYLNRTAAEMGLAADEADNLSVQLEIAEARLAGLAKFAAGSQAFKEAEERVSELREELRELEAQTERNAEADKVLVEEQKKLIKENAEYEKSIESLNDKFEQGSKVRIGAISRETKELEAARRSQLKIEQEFQKLVDDITKPDIQAEDVSLGDVFLRQRQAQAAAERGDTEAAIKLSREGGDLLGLLKEKGTETSGTLKFLAEQIQKVATEAAAAQTEGEVVDVDNAKLAFAEFQRQADFLKQNAPAAGSEYAQLFLEGMRKELAGTTLPAPQIAPISRSAVSLPISDNTGGQSVLNSLVDKQGAK